MGVRLVVVSVSRAEAEPGEGEGEAASWTSALGRIVIGRGASADVVLPHPSVSSRHASIEVDGIHYTIVDHDSLNGTWINGQRIVPGRKKALRDGDHVDVGLFTLRFHANVPTSDAGSREHTAFVARRLLAAARVELPREERRLVVVNGEGAGRVIPLPRPPARVVLGRSEDVEVPLRDADASREHAELVLDADGATIRDLGSKNGVFVGEERVRERRLADRDELRIGRTVLAFEDPELPSLRALEALEDEPCPPPKAPTPDAITPSEPDRRAEGEALGARAPAPLEAMMASQAGTIAAVDGAEQAAPVRAAPEEPRRARREPPSGVAAGEWAVYALAALVVALSLGALFWLLR